MRSLADYRQIVGDDVIHSICLKARNLYGKHVLHLNSTYQGGGVAEMLVSLLPLMNDTGLDAGWRILHGHPDFFTITKKFHNALQGDAVNLTPIKKRLYVQANEDFSVYTHVDHDCVIIHDPQPLPLIMFYKKRQPWVWRCHIDLSSPNAELWEYLKHFIIRYDAVVISNQAYRKDDLPVEQRVVYPAIDPLAPKNIKLSEKDVTKYLKKFDVPTDKPFITQVSRFDKHKDPSGAIRIFKKVRDNVDCRLVLCGSMATDDPEALQIYETLARKARHEIEAGDVVLTTLENDILVNVLQETAAVILQKSKKEGFGLAVTEALWKGKAVVASRVGGIPLQLEDGVNGFLLEPDDEDGFADRLVKVLEDPSLAGELGAHGRETVREKFLITRLVADHLDLLNDLLT
ncbi:MAG: glycosyltransferase [candidate division Zixibacteria bacterium]|nr:glycosyltransferase [candidate division Zixibacteria bacterium]